MCHKIELYCDAVVSGKRSHRIVGSNHRHWTGTGVCNYLVQLDVRSRLLSGLMASHESLHDCVCVRMYVCIHPWVTTLVYMNQVACMSAECICTYCKLIRLYVCEDVFPFLLFVFFSIFHNKSLQIPNLTLH